TCTEEGHRTYYLCSVCEEMFGDISCLSHLEKEETVLPPIGHDYSTWETVIAATQDEPGMEQRVCSHDSTHIEQRTINPLSHVHAMVHIPACPPQCTQPGNAEYWTCTACGKIYLDADGAAECMPYEMVLPAAGHDLNHMEARMPSCTETGLAEHWICGKCGTCFLDSKGSEPVVADLVILSRLPHSLKHIEAKEATCTEDGNAAYWICEVCGCLFLDSQGEHETQTEEVLLSAVGHQFGEWQKVSGLSNNEEGLEVRICANDPTHVETRMSPVHTHLLERMEAVSPSCTENGRIEHWKCMTCGKLFADASGENEILSEDTTIAPLGHQFGKWHTVREATEDEEGWEERVCKHNPAHTEGRAVPEKSHSLIKTEFCAPTADHPGNITYWSCSDCERLFADPQGEKEIQYEHTILPVEQAPWTTFADELEGILSGSDLRITLPDFLRFLAVETVRVNVKPSFSDMMQLMSSSENEAFEQLNILSQLIVSMDLLGMHDIVDGWLQAGEVRLESPGLAFLRTMQNRMDLLPDNQQSANRSIRREADGTLHLSILLTDDDSEHEEYYVFMLENGQYVLNR
ncbi:MAG: hypothetical protein IJI38_05440, partial [Clostridia bacterium]|nr:hypothetical protein [Clostridia bacterium]